MVIQNKYLPYIYQKACKKPVKKGKILFADAHHTELTGNMKPVYQKLKNGGYDIQLYCEDIQTMPVWRMIAFMKDMFLLIATFYLFHPVGNAKKQQLYSFGILAA